MSATRVVPLHADFAGTDPLAALTGLTFGNNDPARVDAVCAIAQLTRLRRLELTRPHASRDDVQLAQLLTLSRLTFLDILGGQYVAEDSISARADTSSV